MASDPYRYFRVEARELLEQLSKGLLELEKETANTEVVPRLLRLAHTLKGAARVVKERGIADSSHALEEILSPLRDGSSSNATTGQIDRALELLDGIGARVEALHSPEAAAVDPVVAVAPEPPPSLRSLRSEVSEIDALLDGVTETHAQIASIRANLDGIGHARMLTNLLVEHLALQRGASPAASSNGARDKVAALTSELRSSLTALERGFAHSFERADREIRQVREGIEGLRLAPARSLFVGLERAARDVANAQGKRIAFEGRGGEVRLDSHVLEVVQAALHQLVRNAVAHGIEPEAQRRTAGKPPAGSVVVSVSRRGSRVSLTCSDDGRGFDLEVVREVAQRKGLVSGSTASLTSDQWVALLLKGGLSTSGQVTEVSGRGIGLDVVRDVAKQLGAEIDVKTEPGRGVVFELIVPQSLTSLEALIVEGGGVVAMIPLDTVQRGLRLEPGNIARTATGETCLDQGQAIPFLSLARAFGKPASTRGKEAWSVVVLETRSGRVALGVDRLSGTATIVVHPLPELTPASPIVAGACVDVDGTARIVLDADALIAAAGSQARVESAAAEPLAPILVIDDSLTTRMLEQSILESAGYQVEVATSAEEALEKALRTRYLLFLVDVEMPGMNGFEFIERIHADSALRDIPAVLVTSRSSPEDRERGARVGARAYIVKSEFDQVELLERIRSLIR